MTVKEAEALRANWEGQTVIDNCRHLALELEYTDLGDSVGKYICIVCGEWAANGLAP